MGVFSAAVALLLVGAVAVCSAGPAGDLVDQIPGFPKTTFKVYSGYLHVPGPVGGYDALNIHYEFHESQGNPAKDPVVTWHQGGPGGSSLYGAYGEMGYFQLGEGGNFVSNYSWNRVSNMLYLESPAGSDDPIGFSNCYKGGVKQHVCSWDDKTQAEAYAYTLVAFFKAFPEFAGRELYLTGESYAGQYVPNIASYIINHEAVNKTLNLKGIAVGNGCWGGSATEVDCNGPNSRQNDIDMYFGKGLVSKPLYEQVYKACKFPDVGPNCERLLQKASEQVGPHDVYDIYDNCPNQALNEWLEQPGNNMYKMLQQMRAQMHLPASQRKLEGFVGGYDWSCGAMDLMPAFFGTPAVLEALHLNKTSGSGFNYDASGPASITLYPQIVKYMRVLIYNGDSDACVPYKGNEEWTESMATNGYVSEAAAWHPWYTQTDKTDGKPPSGYATTYTVNSPVASDASFGFVTIRLAGHMVPQFQPRAAYEMFERFVANTPF